MIHSYFKLSALQMNQILTQTESCHWLGRDNVLVLPKRCRPKYNHVCIWSSSGHGPLFLKRTSFQEASEKKFGISELFRNTNSQRWVNRAWFFDWPIFWCFVHSRPNYAWMCSIRWMNSPKRSQRTWSIRPSFWFTSDFWIFAVWTFSARQTGKTFICAIDFIYEIEDDILYDMIRAN